MKSKTNKKLFLSLEGIDYFTCLLSNNPDLMTKLWSVNANFINENSVYTHIPLLAMAY